MKDSGQPAPFFQRAGDQTFDCDCDGSGSTLSLSWSRLANERLSPSDVVVPWFGREKTTGRTWHSFEWTRLHKAPAQLEPLPLVGDVVVDSALDTIGSGLALHGGKGGGVKNLLETLTTLAEKELAAPAEDLPDEVEGKDNTGERGRILAARNLIAHFR